MHFLLVLYVLAVMRLTRLVTADTVLDPLRLRLARRYGPESRVLEFLGCPWCVGFWLSLAAAPVVIAAVGWSWWLVVPLGLACSQVVGMLSPLYSDEDIAIETVEVE